MPGKRPDLGKIKCRVCEKTISYRNYERHLLEKHKNEDCKDLRTKNCQNISLLLKRKCNGDNDAEEEAGHSKRRHVSGDSGHGDEADDADDADDEDLLAGNTLEASQDESMLEDEGRVPPFKPRDPSTSSSDSKSSSRRPWGESPQRPNTLEASQDYSYSDLESDDEKYVFNAKQKRKSGNTATKTGASKAEADSMNLDEYSDSESDDDKYVFSAKQRRKAGNTATKTGASKAEAASKKPPKRVAAEPISPVISSEDEEEGFVSNKDILRELRNNTTLVKKLVLEMKELKSQLKNGGHSDQMFRQEGGGAVEARTGPRHQLQQAHPRHRGDPGGGGGEAGAARQGQDDLGGGRAAGVHREEQQGPQRGAGRPGDGVPQDLRPQHPDVQGGRGEDGGAVGGAEDTLEASQDYKTQFGLIKSIRGFEKFGFIYNSGARSMTCKVCQENGKLKYEGELEVNVKESDEFRNIKKRMREHLETNKHRKRSKQLQENEEENKIVRSKSKIAGFNVTRIAYAQTKLRRSKRSFEVDVMCTRKSGGKVGNINHSRCEFLALLSFMIV